MTFLLGDCLEVMKSLAARSVDCFICDLPYGQLATGNSNKTLNRIENGNTTGKRAQTENGLLSGCPWDVKINLKEFWEQVRRLSKDDHTPVIMFCNTKFGFELYNSNPDWFRYDLVWNKERGVSFLLANKMPMKSHEMIYIFSKKGSYYKRIDIKTNKPDWKLDYTKSENLKSRQYGIDKEIKVVREGKDGKRCPLSVLEFKSSVKSGLHPTEKCIEIYKWLLERYCPPGGTVLDPTAGSFNSIFAAKKLGLKGIGIEKDRNFFWKAIAKLEKIDKSISIKKDTPPIPANVIELK